MVEDRLDMRALAALFKSAQRLHCSIVSIGGGEPLLRQDICAVIRMIDTYNMSTHLNTNGSLLNESCIKDLQKAGLHTIVVSLDSPNADMHDEIRGIQCFYHVIRMIHCLRSKAPKMNVLLNCVISRKNYTQLKEMVTLAEDLKIHGIKFLPMHRCYAIDYLAMPDKTLDSDIQFQAEDFPFLEEKITELIAFLKKRPLITNSYAFLKHIPFYYRNIPSVPCAAGYLFCNIRYDGMVFPCYRYESIGSIFQRSLEDLWTSAPMDSVRAHIRACRYACWNSGTAEPSLRMRPWSMLNNIRLMLRERKIYIG